MGKIIIKSCFTLKTERKLCKVVIIFIIVAFISFCLFCGSIPNPLIDVGIGALSSLIAWWILNYCITPKIKFSDNISQIEEGSHKIYRFKFENNGCRKIFDAEIIAKLRIKGLKHSTLWEVMNLPLDNDHIPIISSIKKKKRKFREVPRLELQLIEQKYFRFLPEKIKEKINDDSITLEDLMNLGTDSELILYVTGFDEISGARKTFVSKPYKINDIKNGLFDNHGLNVIYHLPK